MRITVRQTSGKILQMEVEPGTTVMELKQRLKDLQPCQDELIREVSEVQLVLGERCLEDGETLTDPTEELLVVFGITPGMTPVQCACAEDSEALGVKKDALLVVDIPPGTEAIKEEAFADCTSLRAVRIPNSVTRIEDYAFCECSSLSTIMMPDSVISIGREAFAKCRSLTSVAIPSSVTKIPYGAFARCNSLRSLDIPDSVTSIGEFSFADCSSLTSVAIPCSVALIDEDAFLNCSSLTALTIPSSVWCLGVDAFKNCRLRKLSLPQSLAGATWAFRAREWAMRTVRPSFKSKHRRRLLKKTSGRSSAWGSEPEARLWS